MVTALCTLIMALIIGPRKDNAIILQSGVFLVLFSCSFVFLNKQIIEAAARECGAI